MDKNFKQRIINTLIEGVIGGLDTSQTERMAAAKLVIELDRLSDYESDFSVEDVTKLLDLIGRGKKIAAIRLVRNKTTLSLKDAHDLVKLGMQAELENERHKVRDLTARIDDLESMHAKQVGLTMDMVELSSQGYRFYHDKINELITVNNSRFSTYLYTGPTLADAVRDAKHHLEIAKAMPLV